MKLYGTYPSHFTRKARVILHELALPYEFIVVTQLLETGKDKFANNPLHQIPVFHTGSEEIFESDLICEYLLKTHGASAPQLVHWPESSTYWENAKRLAIINGAMSAGVKLIRAQRSEIPDFQKFPFFKQEREALEASFLWLNEDLGAKNKYAPETSTLSLPDISLQCLLEWAIFRNFFPNLNLFPNLQRFQAYHAARPSFAATHPSKEGSA